MTAAHSTPHGPLADAFDLTRIDDTTWQAPARDMGLPQLFGGQLVGQSLVVASAALGPDKVIHSSYTSFLRPGRNTEPVRLHAEVLREGRQQGTVRVSVRQGEREVCSTTVTSGTVTPGVAHQRPMGTVTPPEASPTFEEFARAGGGMSDLWSDLTGVELRVSPEPVTQQIHSAVPVHNIWMRTEGRLPDAPDLQRAALGYASDLMLMSMALVPHGVGLHEERRVAEEWWGVSLDHALWFAGDFRADDWLCFEHSTSMADSGRALVEASVFTTDGRLVARVAQQAMVRPAAASL